MSAQNKQKTNEQDNDIVIVAARRTPLGSMQGAFASLSAPALASHVLKAIIEDSGVNPDSIDELIMGCVLSAGVGQAPARQACLQAGLPISVSCTTVNKVCGSAMKAVMLAHDAIKAGSAQRVIAGGMESMTNAPYLLAKARQGYRLGHQEVLDHMFFDGLENASDRNLMGYFAERCVDRFAFTREQQDAFAIESVKRARHAAEHGWFKDEIVAVPVATKGSETVITDDEQPAKSRIDKIPTLRPAFRKDGGSVTAANSSSISDGAAALLLMTAGDARQQQIKPLARILTHSSFAQAPEDFTTAPVGAINKLQDMLGWGVDDVDLYEINEAFAVVTMAAMHELALPAAKVNIHGGACALGHPIGASGTRIIVTLLHALQRNRLRRGIAAMCIGGGEATAVAIELCQ